MTYEEACDALRAVEKRERADPAIDPARGSRTFLHGRPTDAAIVLWHGFTNAPPQFVPLAEQLFADGCNVYVPLLPLHGHRDRMTTALAALKARDLEKAAGEAAAIAAGLGAATLTTGISLGGVSAAWLAQYASCEAAVPVAPFFAIPGLPRAANYLLARILAGLPNFWMWWDPRVKEGCLPLHGYPRFPTHALAAVIEFGRTVFAGAGRERPRARRCVSALNAKDPAVNNNVTRELASLWSAKGACSETYVFTNLDRRHDIIEPTTYPDAPKLVYPVLTKLLLGK